MSMEDIAELSEGAKEVNDIILQSLTPEFFEHKTRKHIKTLNSETELIIKGGSVVYTLCAPYYISRLEIKSSEQLRGKVSVFFKIAGKTTQVSSDMYEKDGLFKFPINNYVTEVVISQDPGFFSAVGVHRKTIINKVCFYGLDPDKLSEAIESVKTLASLKKNISDLEEKIKSENNEKLEKIAAAKLDLEESHANLDALIEGKRTELSGLEHMIEGRYAELRERILEVDQKAAEHTNLSRDIEAKKSHKSSLESEIEGLNSLRSNLSAAVRSLQENKSLFTDEIASYAKQGSSNIFMYFCIILTPLAILGFMSWELLSNAADLAKTAGGNSISQAFSYLIARVPYAVVSITIIFACYEVVKHIFEKIFYIHKDRLKLSSLSILAKDMTDAARLDLDLSDEEIYEMRVKARMDLIKWHIQDGAKGSSDFEGSIRPKIDIDSVG